ncbi:MAG TPA: DUF6265 family protein [Gemmatimonadaceae bacterium]|nr:DUF6265 family protein [Gemmatimonadaceae bacterium]
MSGRRLARFAVIPIALGTAGTIVAVDTGAKNVLNAPRIESVAWLQGCWQRTSTNSVIDEQWMRPGGGTMMGLSRTVRRMGQIDTTTEFEFLRLFARAGKLVYAAHPSGQSPAEFTESESGDASIVFANPQHDFPQRIIYRKRGADSLIARIEGTIGGNTRAMDFPYRRVSCDPSPTSSS